MRLVDGSKSYQEAWSRAMCDDRVSLAQLASYQAPCLLLVIRGGRLSEKV